MARWREQIPKWKGAVSRMHQSRDNKNEEDILVGVQKNQTKLFFEFMTWKVDFVLFPRQGRDGFLSEQVFVSDQE